MVRKHKQTCTQSRRVVLRLLKCLWIHMQKQKPTLFKDRNMRALNCVLKRLGGYLSSNNESLWMMTMVVMILLPLMCNYCYATGNDPNYDYWLVWMKWRRAPKAPALSYNDDDGCSSSAQTHFITGALWVWASVCDSSYRTRRLKWHRNQLLNSLVYNCFKLCRFQVQPWSFAP